MARSLTVPWTASEPMSPPGKNRGVTTKLSVLSTTSPCGVRTTAASSSVPVVPSAGVIRSRSSSAISWPPEPWPSRRRSVSVRGTGQVRVAGSVPAPAPAPASSGDCMIDADCMIGGGVGGGVVIGPP